MKTALKIFAFTILVSAFYSYVGQMVPQKITYPPEETVIGANLSTDEMVTIGQQITGGKGTCLTCHTIGSHDSGLRFPDLGNIGAIAGDRREGQTDVQYIAESMYDPNAYIVEGFVAGMPQVSRPPIALSDEEILTVIAYLQSLGGTPTVTMDTKLEWQGQAPAQPAAATPAVAPGVVGTGPEIVAKYFCATCHNFDADVAGAGPSLVSVGSRLSKAEIYESIMDPDAVVADGFAPGIMTATLNAQGFYDKISTKELQALVDYLNSLEG